MCTRLSPSAVRGVGLQGIPGLLTIGLMVALYGVMPANAQTRAAASSGVSYGLHARSLQALASDPASSADDRFWTSIAPANASEPGSRIGLQSSRMAVTGGYRWANGQALSLTSVQDTYMPSLTTQVQLVYQTPALGAGRVTVGFNSRSNHAAGLLSMTRPAVGLSVGYDWSGLSLRMNYEPWVGDAIPPAIRLTVTTPF